MSSFRRGSVRSRAAEEVNSELQDQTKESYNTRNQQGKFGNIFINTLPEGLTIWKCKEAEHVIDIIPFLAGPQHPKREEGQSAYNLDVWAHRNVGASEDMYICMQRTLDATGKPLGRCPICEFQKTLLNQEIKDKKLIKSLNPSRRCVYNIWVHDDSQEREKGVQVWEFAHWFFESKIIEIARNPRGGGMIPFAHPDKGKSIMFVRRGTTNTEVLGHRFVDRDYEIPDAIFQEAWALDMLVNWPTYEEVWEAFFMEPYEKGKQMPTTMPGMKQETSEGYDYDYRDDIVEPAYTRETMPLDETMIPGSEYQPEQKQEPVFEPKRKAHQTHTPAGDCPGGGTFGVDTDNLGACQTCEKWDDCYDEKSKKAKAKRKRIGGTVRRGRA